TDKNTPQYLVTTNSGQVVGALTAPFDVDLKSDFEIWTAELQQIVQDEHGYLIAGGKFQSGHFNDSDLLTLSPSAAFLQSLFNNPPAALDSRDDFQRWSVYGYYNREVVHNLWLTAGFSYEAMTFPSNFREPPIFSGTTTREQANPKGALIWSPI